MPAPRNRSLVIEPVDTPLLLGKCVNQGDFATPIQAMDFACGGNFDGKLVLGDALAILPQLPSDCFDLIIVDPPYNLTKDFDGFSFGKRETGAYLSYLRSWMGNLARSLMPGGTMYICAEWRSSAAVQMVAAEFLEVRSRITWEREKGRGASMNWKNSSEDIWFCTKGNQYHFDVDAVKLRRIVRAPYRDAGGKTKDWIEDPSGKERGWRDTHPSNLWTDLTVPFWSMPENTLHPTQKPEKLAAKLILASSRAGDLVFDPFAGSGTSLAVARKLGRRWFGIEQNPIYAALAQKRLELAAADTRIQGYEDGIFHERNSPGNKNRR